MSYLKELNHLALQQLRATAEGGPFPLKKTSWGLYKTCLLVQCGIDNFVSAHLNLLHSDMSTFS